MTIFSVLQRSPRTKKESPNLDSNDVKLIRGEDNARSHSYLEHDLGYVLDDS
jgi:hypothetical protein